MNKSRILFALVCAYCAVSCGNEEAPKTPKHYSKEQLLTANKVDAHRESDDIDAFVSHHHYDMKATGTGLRYMFLSHSLRGDSVHSGQFAKVSYTVFLLNGTRCYSSDEDGQREFKVGEDHIESGIHEAVLLMKTGDKLRFVLPSNLAHGLLGDGDKIPPRAPVLYEIELRSVR
ncbi:MAG: FKBP-type peptidyl-prolyl cis-trans isomerase [Bacteroidia bacterium]